MHRAFSGRTSRPAINRISCCRYVENSSRWHQNCIWQSSWHRALNKAGVSIYGIDSKKLNFIPESTIVTSSMKARKGTGHDSIHLTSQSIEKKTKTAYSTESYSKTNFETVQACINRSMRNMMEISLIRSFAQKNRPSENH